MHCTVDCAVDEKCCSVNKDGAFSLFFLSALQGIWQLKCSRPREFAIRVHLELTEA